ncbi:hypothetical protein [Actinophytocola sp.]|uniref:hypothetical protein n=1 Tax=Actinophytocola sp. TaxID=1872138 RepID=UPI002ED33C44
MKRLLLIPALLGALVAVAPAAQAAPVRDVHIAVTPDGFAAPATLPAGPVTLHVRSTDPGGAWVGLVRPRPGVTLERYLDALARAMGDDPVEGGRAVARDVEMLGGVAVAHVPASATLRVAPGDHYLIDFRDVGLPDLAERVHRVRVLPSQAGRTPAPAARIVLRDGVFETPATLSGPVQVINQSCQHNEAMLMPVRAGTTLVDLDAFFTEVDAGRRPAGSLFTGGPTGVVPLSPRRSAVLSTDLPPGEYALVTWVRDVATGTMFAARGMRALITVEG